MTGFYTRSALAGPQTSGKNSICSVSFGTLNSTVILNQNLLYFIALNIFDLKMFSYIHGARFDGLIPGTARPWTRETTAKLLRLISVIILIIYLIVFLLYSHYHFPWYFHVLFLIAWFPFAAFGIIVQLKFDRFCSRPPSNSTENGLNDTLTNATYSQIPIGSKQNENKTGDLNENRQSCSSKENIKL